MEFQHFLPGARNWKPWRGRPPLGLPSLYSQRGDLGQAVPLLSVWGEERKEGSWNQGHRGPDG